MKPLQRLQNLLSGKPVDQVFDFDIFMIRAAHYSNGIYTLDFGGWLRNSRPTSTENLHAQSQALRDLASQAV
jgi:hypothetical protein